MKKNRIDEFSSKSMEVSIIAKAQVRSNNLATSPDLIAEADSEIKFQDLKLMSMFRSVGIHRRVTRRLLTRL